MSRPVVVRLLCILPWVSLTWAHGAVIAHGRFESFQRLIHAAPVDVIDAPSVPPRRHHVHLFRAQPTSAASTNPASVMTPP